MSGGRAYAPDPVRDWLRMVGGLAFAAGALVLFIRKSGGLQGSEDWAGFPLFLVLAVPVVLLYGLGLGAGRERIADQPQPWQEVLLLTAVLLYPVALFQLVDTLGGDTSNSLHQIWIWGSMAALAGYAAFVLGSSYQALVASLALGGLACSVMVEVAGIESALAASGLLLPAFTGLAWMRLRAIDAEAAPPPRRVLELLRAVPMFRPLPAPALEGLAFASVRIELAAGETVFSQGDHGDRYYVVDSRTVDVLVDGRHVREQGPGSAFGEIALVRDVPRTATIRAVGPLVLWALERHHFLAAIWASPQSAEGAERVVAARLSYARPAIGAP